MAKFAVVAHLVASSIHKPQEVEFQGSIDFKDLPIMLIRHPILLTGFAFISTSLLMDGSPKIHFTQQTYRSGEKVVAQIDAPRDVVIENGISQSSKQVSINGSKKIDLGTIPTTGGFYSIRVRDGDKSTDAVLLASPKHNVSTAIAFDGNSISTSATFSESLNKLVSGIDKRRLKSAAEKAIGEWLPKNLAQLQATGTACIVCLIPANPFSCSYCASSSTSESFDLMVSIIIELIEIMKNERVLNAQEAESLIRVAKRGAAAVALIAAEGKLEKSLEALDIVIEAIVESQSVQFIVGNAKGLAGSFSMYLKIIKAH